MIDITTLEQRVKLKDETVKLVNYMSEKEYVFDGYRLTLGKL